jgi:cysteine desulfurase
MNTASPIYLDHNSTTPLDPAVAAAIADCWSQGYLNPASQHRAGQLARRALEKSRSSIISLLGGRSKGMDADSLVITSGGTESNNLALVGMTLAGFEQQQERHPAALPADYQVLVSAIEHPSLMGAAEYLARLGFSVQRISVDRQGRVALDHLESLLQQPTLLVSVMLANNETGVIQVIEQIAKLCQQNGVLLHTDAVQAVAKIPVHFRNLGVSALSFTAHKFNGPRGVGGLLLRHGVQLKPILFGGFQQMARRPGTEDVASVVGMEVALRLFFEHPERMDRVAALRDQLQIRLLQLIPDAVVIGGTEKRVPSTLNIAFPGIDRQAFLMAADLIGIALSTGSACASGSSETSPVLKAMRLENEVLESAVRISLGVTNTPDEIEIASCHISSIINHLRQQERRE